MAGACFRCLRMWNSGIRRPEVEPLEPKVKVLPAMPAGKPSADCGPVLAGAWN